MTGNRESLWAFQPDIFILRGKWVAWVFSLWFFAAFLSNLL